MEAFTVAGFSARLLKEAARQGLSDGRFGYPLNPADFEGAARQAYQDSYWRGVADRKEHPHLYGREG